MRKRNFSDVKEELARVASQTGLPAGDARLRAAVYLAQERLSTLGEWVYQYARVKFRLVGGVLSLPSEYEALVHATINRANVEVMPPWFEFLEFGPGPVSSSTWNNNGVDQGESPVFLQPRAATTVNVTSGGADTSNVTIFGLDQTGAEVSAVLALPNTTSSVQFTKITRVMKLATLGRVTLTYTTGTIVAGIYRKRDTLPTFRNYRFPAIRSDRTIIIDAIVRRRLIDVVDDSSELFITNLGALRLAIKAIALEDKGDVANANGYFELAAKILRDESNEYRASSNPAPLNVTRVASLSARSDIY